MKTSSLESIDDTHFKAFLEPIIQNGFEGITELMGILMNEAMKIEREKHIKAYPYEHSSERNGYANGYKAKVFHTRMGPLSLSIPQVRDSDSAFYPKSLEKGSRSEQALKLAVAEMYVNGVATRKVEKITQELCGFEISSTEVSRCAKLLDEKLEKFRNRPLNPFSYVYLDAHYQKVRHNGIVISVAVLTALGVNEDGKREVLGSSVELSEAEIHWRNFLQILQKRGLHGVKLFISDSHSGLRQALRAVFPSVKWQRCQFHLAQNAQKLCAKENDERRNRGSCT